MAKPLRVGNIVRLRAIFRFNGVETDPTVIVFKIKTPDASTSTLTYGTDVSVVKEATGIYYVDYTLTQTGYHTWSATGTGALVAAEDATFYVRLSTP